MTREEVRPRKGSSIREFLRYYVLALLRSRGRTAERIVETIKKESACNRDFRPSGQLLVDKEELNRVLAQLRSGQLIESAGAKWRITTEGRQKLALYEDRKEEQSNAKERAARELLKLLGRCKPGQRVLDVGTGDGYLAFKAAEKGCRVLGIDSGSFDYSKDSIKTARQKAESQGGKVEFRQVSVLSLQGMDGSFDYVVTSQAIHCVKDQRECVEAIHRLLKPGGTFLCMDFLVGLEGFLCHNWHVFLAISKEEWAELLPECGFVKPGFHKAGDYLVLMARKPSCRPQKC